MTRLYDTRERRFDDQKRRVTDFSECARVTLPRPIETKNEAMIEIRRNTNGNIYNKYREEVCNKRGEVKGNLTEEEKDGLRSLQKRMREKEIILMKSEKLFITTREEYMKMGEEHTQRDEKIDRTLGWARTGVSLSQVTYNYVN